MSRWEFMRQLEELLSDISPSEREEALQYYNDYINDAGKENEADVIWSLGSPEQVAKTVKEGLLGEDNLGEFTENGYSASKASGKNSLISRKTDTSEQSRNTQNGQKTESSNGQSKNHFTDPNGQKEEAYRNQSTGTQAETKKEGLPTWAIILIVIGCVFLSPVILGLTVSALGVIFSIFAATISLILGFGIAGIVCIIVMIALLGAGLGCMLTEPLAAFALIGIGLICGAVGILFIMLTVFLVGICIPGICKCIAYIFRKLFGKKEVASC